MTTAGDPVEDPCKGLGFRVLSNEERAAIKARTAEIKALELDEPTRRFVLATYYAGQELRGEALALLDELSGTLGTPAVYLWRVELLPRDGFSRRGGGCLPEGVGAGRGILDSLPTR